MVLALGCSASLASPYLPVDDGVILEHVPARSALERLAPLRAAVAANPADLPAALALAKGYIEIGRRDADPRFIAYAQATLSPWLARPPPPEPVLVQQATALQYLHQFNASLALIDQALALEPLDGQAWLTRATLLELQGRYPEARRACARLVRTVDALVALTCLKSVEARTGRLAASYAALRTLPISDPRLPAAVRGWALSELADMAERLGDEESAEANLKNALQSAPEDPYLKASCADLLLRRNRPAQVIALLRGNEAQDALLLRLAIAGKRASSPEAGTWAAMYEERMRAAVRDRDYTHQRERAMFLLEVRGDARAALTAAVSNWAAQREPADLRIYAAAAQRAASIPDLTAIGAWLAAVHYEDRTLTGRP
ncbi:MAG TPA: tetratricopeptide repeat protein [Steroidobacteraceae bacterium]